MRSSSSSISDRFVNETVRRIDIFSAFMESFNTGLRLPPVMANLRKRVEELESTIKGDDSTVNTEVRSDTKSNEPPSVDSLIETVEEPMIKDCPHREKIEHSVRELTSKVNELNGVIDDKDKQITKLNTSIIQLNTTLEEAIRRIHTLEKQMQENTQMMAKESPVASDERTPSRIHSEVTSDAQSIDTSNFATKQELKDTEKRIIKELTDKIDAELIDAEERFDAKLKESTEAIKLALDETIGGELEEEDEEEEDIDGVIDMD